MKKNVALIVADATFLSQTGAIPSTVVYTVPADGGLFRITVATEGNNAAQAGAIDVQWTDNFFGPHSSNGIGGGAVNDSVGAYGNFTTYSISVRCAPNSNIVAVGSGTFTMPEQYNAYVVVEQLQ